MRQWQCMALFSFFIIPAFEDGELFQDSVSLEAKGPEQEPRGHSHWQVCQVCCCHHQEESLNPGTWIHPNPQEQECHPLCFCWSHGELLHPAIDQHGVVRWPHVRSSRCMSEALSWTGSHHAAISAWTVGNPLPTLVVQLQRFWHVVVQLWWTVSVTSLRRSSFSKSRRDLSRLPMNHTAGAWPVLAWSVFLYACRNFAIFSGSDTWVLPIVFIDCLNDWTKRSASPLVAGW